LYAAYDEHLPARSIVVAINNRRVWATIAATNGRPRYLQTALCRRRRQLTITVFEQWLIAARQVRSAAAAAAADTDDARLSER
jgi:hypothetical protein